MQQSTRSGSPTEGGAPSPPSAGGRLLPGDRGGRVWLLLSLLLALFAYRRLLWLEPERSLPEEIEEWFFIPSDTIAPVVVLMTLWLLYRRRARLLRLPAGSGAPLLAAALLVGGTAFYGWATLTGASDLLVPSLMLNAFGLAALWKGAPALRAVRLPVAFLFFAMPLPAPLLNEVVFRLQIWTAELSGWLLFLLRVPHFVAGEQILTSTQVFSIIEACSGLRSVETLTMVAILMIDLFRRRGLHALLVVAAAPPVAFFLNGCRAITLILNPHSDIAAIHNLQGVAILLSGLLILFVFDGLLGRLEAPEPASPRRRIALPPAAPPAPRARLIAAAGVLAVASAASLWLPMWPPVPYQPLHLASTLRLSMGGLLASEIETDSTFLGSVGFGERSTQRFLRYGKSVELFVGVGSRSVRLRSPLSPKTGLPGSGWVIEEEGPVVLEPGAIEARARLLRSGSRRVLVYHWYEGAGSWLGELARAFLALDRSPLRRAEQIVAVRLGTQVVGPVPAGRREAAGVLAKFYRRLRPALDRLQDRKKFSLFTVPRKRFSSAESGGA